MTRLLCIAIFVCSFLGLTALGWAYDLNQDHLKTLKETRVCRVCKLEGADLSGLDLDGMDVTNASLSGAKFIGTSLKYADMSGASLGGADFTDANLRYADLRWIRGGGITWTGADLSLAKWGNSDVCKEGSIGFCKK